MVAGWVVGVLVSVLGACLDNLGVTLQKSSHMLRGGEEGAARDGARPYYRELRWQLGFVIFLLGNVFNVVGLGLAPETLFAAIGGVTLVANAFNSHFLLGEPLTPRVLVATLVIVTGSVVAVLFSTHPDEDFDLHDLLHFLTPVFFVYLGVMVTAMVALFGAVVRARRDSRRFEARYVAAANDEPDPVSPRSGAEGSPGAELLAVSSLSPAGWRARTGSVSDPDDPEALRRHERRGVFLSFAIPAFAGMVGSFTVLLAKCVAELVKVTSEGRNQFDSPVPYALVLAVAVSGFAQVHWLNVGLRGYNQIIVVPSFLAVYTTFSILGGVFFFRETRGFSPLEAALFPCGTLLAFAGVFMIATRPNQLSERVTGGLLAGDAETPAFSRTVSTSSSVGGGGGGGGGGSPLLAAAGGGPAGGAYGALLDVEGAPE